MSRSAEAFGVFLSRLGTRYLPFADVASAELPLVRLVRLGLFQVTVGMVLTLLAGTLNRVMIVELGVGAGIVAVMLALPMVFAPFRALIGFRSDHHRSALGWRRVPYLWFGTLLQFGGLAILPFALLLLGGTGVGPGAEVGGTVGAALAFLMVGAGAHTVQTAGLALATDLAPEEDRPRVVALLYLLLLAGMLVSALCFSWLLRDYSAQRLVEVVQGAAVVTMVLNIVALWKQEARGQVKARTEQAALRFRDAWTSFLAGGRTGRLLAAVALGSAGFAMQDVLLEPYGGEVMAMGVGSTSLLTAMTAGGAIFAFALSARILGRGGDPCRLAAMGTLAGVFSFAAVILAAPLSSAPLLGVGSAGIGFGGGLFTVGTLTAAMELSRSSMNGLAVGAWGAVHATAAGLAIASGGILRDILVSLSARGLLGEALSGPEAGYIVVYHVEIAILFLAMATLGRLVAPIGSSRVIRSQSRFGLAQMPG
jgi:MFS transporter, BCD family, chlorophyll transporter